jgi:hypothetical protein
MGAWHPRPWCSMGPTYPWRISFTVRHGYDDICGAPICGAPRILIRGAPKLSAPQIMGPWIRVFLVVPLPPTYTLWPETIGGSSFFLDRVPLRRHHQKPRFGTRNSVLALCRDGDLEEIFIINITDVSPSTIHDSRIHVWEIPAVGEGDGRDWMRLFM